MINEPLTREETSLTPGELVTVDKFNRIFYNERAWATTYLGNPLMKNPMDLWVMQLIVYGIRPDVIIETGTFRGGSALYYAKLFDALYTEGRVITVDLEKHPDLPCHHRICYITGDSASPDVFEKVKALIPEKSKVMVVLDSDHAAGHVLSELRLYAPLVSVGSYCVVEDTNVEGPLNAIQEFFDENHDFAVSTECHRFLLTFNRYGFLKRVR